MTSMDVVEALDELAIDKALAWGVVVAYVHYNSTERKDLSWNLRRAIDGDVWALQDGYGEAGATPPQGWDWSGIRDSSGGAITAMAKAIVIRLYGHGIDARPAGRAEAVRIAESKRRMGEMMDEDGVPLATGYTDHGPAPWGRRRVSVLALVG